MAVETPVRPDMQPQTAGVSDTLDMRPVLLLGAGRGLGREIAVRLGVRGYEVLAGMTNPQNFDSLRQEILAAGGVEPKPVIADITDRDQFWNAFDNTQTRTPVHFFPVAAGGLKVSGGVLMRSVGGIRKAADRGATPEQLHDLATEATKTIKDTVTAPGAINEAMDMNVKAPAGIFEELRQRGQIDLDSRLLTTSSSISDEIDPKDPMNFRGPWFYWPAAFSKAMGVSFFAEQARRFNLTHVDAVAPELEGTEVGNFLDKIATVMQRVQPDTPIEIPKVEVGLVADAIVNDLIRPQRGLDRVRKLYVDENGARNTRPSEWDSAAFLPYL